MDDALYQWDANASAFVPFTGDASPPETFDAFTIRAIAEQGMEAGYGAQVVAAARAFGLPPAVVADELPRSALWAEMQDLVRRMAEAGIPAEEVLNQVSDEVDGWYSA